MFYGTKSGVKVFDSSHAPECDRVNSLEVRDLQGEMLVHVSPTGEWTLDKLVAELNTPGVVCKVAEAGGADAYLGSHWVGGSEV